MDLFGNRKSLEEMLKELEAMLGAGFMGGDPLSFKKFKKTDGEWTSESYTSPDGTIKSTIIYSVGGTSNKKPKHDKVERLKDELKIAVENEDFLLAIKLRDMIKELEENKDLISDLQNKLKECIEKQDFEEAIKVRDELRKYE